MYFAIDFIQLLALDNTIVRIRRTVGDHKIDIEFLFQLLEYARSSTPSNPPQ